MQKPFNFSFRHWSDSVNFFGKHTKAQKTAQKLSLISISDFFQVRCLSKDITWNQFEFEEAAGLTPNGFFRI